MDTTFEVQMNPVSPGTPTNTTSDRSSCSAGGYGTPGSFRTCRTRKLARTPTKQREETELFDSLLESFVQGLHDVEERGVNAFILTSTTLHNEESSRCSTLTIKCAEGAVPVQNIPIKLEDLLSDSEAVSERKEGNWKPSMEEEHLLQLASDHYNQRLRRKGMKGLVYNVLEQRQLRLRAEHHFNKKIITKYFIKMKVIFNERKKRRRLAIRRAQLREHTTRATSFHHKRLLERSFLRWRAWCLYRRECRTLACRILIKANTRIAFHLWQKFIQQKQELTRAFQAWRQFIYNNNLKKLSVACCQQKQTVLLQECFHKWILKTAIIAGEGLLSSKLHEAWQQSVCRRTLRGWMLNTQESIGYREVLRHSFRRWRLEAIWLKQTKLADRYCKQRRLKMAMTVWKAEYRQSLDLRVLLSKQANVRELKYLTLWRLATERKYTLKRERLAYNLLRRCMLRKYLSRWKRFNENARALMYVAQRMEHIVHRRLISDTFNIWSRQLHYRRMLRHHLLDSEAQLINRCFSTWRMLTTSTCASTSISELTLLNSEEHSLSNLALASDDSNVEMPSLKLSTRHTAAVQSTPTGRHSDDRLGYLRDLSNQIQQSLQLSSYSRKGAPSVKRTKSVVRRLFVDNDPLPPCSSGVSSVCDSLSQSNSIRLCSCLNPQVAHDIHEFQKRVADYLSGVDRTLYESITHVHIGEIENTECTTHPSNFAQISQCIGHDMLTTFSMHSNAICCCLSIAFHEWRALTRKKRSLRQRSAYLAKLLRLRRLKRSFEIWREAYSKTTTLRSQRNKKLLQKALSQWMLVVKVARQRKQAELLGRYWCMSRAWLKWRQEHIKETTSLAAIQHHNQFLLLQSFTAWRSWTKSEKLY